jgi:hypothetical protein
MEHKLKDIILKLLNVMNKILIMKLRSLLEIYQEKSKINNYGIFLKILAMLKVLEL